MYASVVLKLLLMSTACMSTLVLITIVGMILFSGALFWTFEMGICLIGALDLIGIGSGFESVEFLGLCFLDRCVKRIDFWLVCCHSGNNWLEWV